VLIIRRIDCIDTADSPNDEIEINTKKRIVREVGHLPRIIKRCTVNKI
jgi:hypothetical protein